jgi:hypothetical protein
VNMYLFTGSKNVIIEQVGYCKILNLIAFLSPQVVTVGI